MESLGDNSGRLLDLLSVEGDEIEPTRVQSSSRQALYPEVILIPSFIRMIEPDPP